MTYPQLINLEQLTKTFSNESLLTNVKAISLIVEYYFMLTYYKWLINNYILRLEKIGFRQKYHEIKITYRK